MTGVSNVVVIVVDALRADYLTPERAPTIVSLAESGLNCSNVFSPINTTEPLLTSFYTGQYPRSTGLINHGSNITEVEFDLVQEQQFLQERLRANGFETIAIDWIKGWHQRGYDYYSGELKEDHQTDSNDSKNHGKFARNAIVENLVESCPPDAYAKIRSLVHKIRPPKIEPRGWLPDSAESVTDEAISRIDAAEAPFYLFIHYWDTHVPYEVPVRFSERFGNPSDPKARYSGGIAYVDEQIQRLLGELRNENLREDTLVLVMADHGESLGEHGIYYDHHGLYDETIHVPVILSNPDLPRIEHNSFVQHIDLAPTILDALGEEIPAEMDGRSLLAMADGDADTRSAIIAEEAQTQRKICIRTKRYKYIRLLADDPVCRGCHVVHGGEEELYDLRDDPDETRNIAAERPNVTERFGNRLAHWMHHHRNEPAEIKQAVNSLLKESRL